MITLYGVAASRAFRPLWMLEELALPYRLESIDFRAGETETTAYHEINPNGKIPTLIDGELKLVESMAINLYLASRYGREQGFWPEEAAGEGLAYQWSFWVMGELELPLLTLLQHKRMLPAEQRDPIKVRQSEGAIRRPLSILQSALAGRDYLLDERFSVADLNVAAVVIWSKPARVSLTDYPDLKSWLERCTTRPACKRAQRA